MSVLAESGKDDDSDCNCNTESSISCFPAGPACEDAKCEGTRIGCGWFLVSPCDGLCGGM